MDEDWPLITYLSKAKAIKPSNEIQNHKSKKAFKFNFVLISQNTNLWKTSFGKNSIPNIYLLLHFFAAINFGTLEGSEATSLLAIPNSLFTLELLTKWSLARILRVFP